MDAVPADGPVDASSVRSLLRTVSSYIRLAGRADAAVRRERFDVCQVEYTETAFFWRPPPDLPAVLTCHDIIAKPAYRRYKEARGVERATSYAAWILKRAIERRSVSRYRTVFTLSEEDRDWAGRLYPGSRIRVLRYPGGIGHRGLPRREIPGRVLFVGALNRPQNVESLRFLVLKAWPAVRREILDAELVVAGGGLPARERGALSGEAGVRFAGFVEDLEAEYQSASVFGAPILSGGGIIVKILDAMASRVPVVTTSYGNEGIRAVAGKDILVADDPEEFARGMIRLLKDPALRHDVAERGYLHVSRNFSEEGMIEALESAYAELLA
jgi:glycosyltransferase involved in cell wall biosynthesis